MFWDCNIRTSRIGNKISMNSYLHNPFSLLSTFKNQSYETFQNNFINAPASIKCNNFLFVRFSTRYFLKNKISRCFPKHALVYKMIHLFFLGGSGGSNAASIASSKTFFKPFCKIQKQNYTDGAIFLKKWNSASKYEKKKIC